MAIQKKPPRLPVARFFIRQPNKPDANPCLGVMSSVLGCWASAGHMAVNCQALEDQLRLCMDKKRPTDGKKSDINYQLARMYSRIRGPIKHK